MPSGTFSHGIYIYNKPQKELIADKAVHQAVPVRSITSVGTDRIWAGVDGAGIYEYNRFTGERETEYSHNATGYKYQSIDDESMSRDTMIVSVYR